MQTPYTKDYALYIDQFKAFINSTCPISDQSWKEICDIMVFKEVKKGTRILDYTRVENAVRFIGKGIVKCEDHFNSKSFVYDFRVAPIVLSEIVSFLHNNCSRITLEAVTDCELIELPRELFLKLTFTNIEISKFCTLGVANYLGMLHYKQVLMRTLDAQQRYKHFLKEYPSVAMHAKLEDIASYIGVTQQSLSRIRKNIIWDSNEKELEVLSNELILVHAKNP